MTETGLPGTTGAAPAAVRRPRPSTTLLAIGAAVVGLVAFVLAWSTLLPGVGYWDTAEFQAVGPLLGTAHPTGFPSYLILGWLASVLLQPLGDPAWRMNLLSALLGAGSAALVVVLLHRLTSRIAIALAGGLLFVTIPIVWAISNHADPHAFHLFLVSLLLGLLVEWEARVRPRKVVAHGGPAVRADRWLVASAIVFAIALANHTLTILLIPGVGLFVVAVEPGLILRRVRFVAGLAVVIVALAGLFYLELPLRSGVFRGPLVYGNPSTLSGFLYIVFAQQFQSQLSNPIDHAGEVVATLVTMGTDQLGPLIVLLPIGFAATLVRRPRYALLSGVSFVITAAFAASYSNAQIDRYYLVPALLGVTWIAVLAGSLVDAAAWFGRRFVAARSGPAGGQPVSAGTLRWTDTRHRVPIVALELCLAGLLLAPTVSGFTRRWQVVDMSHSETAAWGEDAMALFAPNAVVVSWWSYSTILWYLQIVDHQRPDILVVDDRTIIDASLGSIDDVVNSELGQRPVYLVRTDPNQVIDAETRYNVAVIQMPNQQPILQILSRRDP